MSDALLLKIILPLSILLQVAAAFVAIRLIRITGKSLAWSFLAAAMVCMTIRRVILLSLLWTTGESAEVNLISETLGLAISLLLFAGMMLATRIYQSIQNARNKLDLASRRLEDASVAGRVALWEWDVLTGVREWSTLVDDMLGFPPLGFPRTYRAWETRIHPNDLAGVQDAIRSNFETNAPYDVTYRILRADGTYAWWHEVAHVNRDCNGSPISLAGASVDITARKQHEEEYATIFQTAMDGILIASARTGRLLDVNDAYCHLVGYTRAELLNLRIADLEANESSDAVTTHLHRIARFGRDRFETSHRCKDGRTMDVLVSAQSIANASRICIFVSDITQRKRNEAALHTRLMEIERFNQLTTTRDQRLIELKQEINRLAQEVGRPPQYTNILDDTATTLLSQLIPPATSIPPPQDLPLHELIDSRQLQPLLESFSASAGVSAALIDLHGEILASANWQPICSDFHRINERSWARCFESDTELASHLDEGQGYALFQCRNGLQMATAPIQVGDRTLGNLFLSQFLLESPDVEAFQLQAAEFGFDEKAYLTALSRVPVISREKLTPLLTFLTSCANLVAQIVQEHHRTRQQECTVQHTTAELQRQREAALNLAQDAIEAHRRLEAGEEALRQNRDMLARVIDSVPQAIFWKDRQSIYLGCNRVFAQTLNLASPQEIVGKTDFDLVPSREEAEAYRADDREVMEHNRHKRHIIESVHCPDGTRIWVDTSKLPLVNKDGQIYGVLAVYEDITEKRHSEEQLRQQSERHRFALETLGAGEWEMDLISFTCQRSQQHARIFGYAPPLAPWTFPDFLQHVVPDDRARVEKTTREAIQSGQDLDYECQITRSDGVRRSIWVRGRHIGIEQGQSVRLAGIVLDITDRKHEANLLRQSKEHLQLALIAIEDAIWDWAPENNRLYWSPRLFTMLGYAPDEFVPSVQTWENLLHPDDRPTAQNLMQQCLNGLRDDLRFEARFRTKTGDWFWILVRGRVLSRGLHGELLRMAGVHIDISERKQQEVLIHQQLEELQRWQAVMLGREQRTLDLKHEINLLLQRLNEPIRYPSAEEGRVGEAR